MSNNCKYPPRKPGRKLGSKPVDKADYPKMAQLADEGYGWGEVGRKFGVTGTTASRIVRKFRGEL